MELNELTNRQTALVMAVEFVKSLDNFTGDSTTVVTIAKRFAYFLEGGQ